MRFSFRTFATTLPACAFALSSAALATTGQSARPDVLNALAKIQQTADSVAAGRYSGSSALQAPARDIALNWSRVAPILVTDGNVLVETKMTNAKVTAFENDWKSKDVRSEAKALSASIADLVDAAKPSKK